MKRRGGRSSPLPARLLAPLLIAAGCAGAPSPAPVTASSDPVSRDDPAQRVEILRTEFGVPHILADDLEAGGFGMAWAQMEDYGPRVVRGLIEARGELGLRYGVDEAEDDFEARLEHRLAVEALPDLDSDAAAVYRGFAGGVNRYVALHPERFGPDRVPGGIPVFQAADVLARDVVGRGSAGAFVRRLEGREAADVIAPAAEGTSGRPDPGSNAWALAPSRTTSGHAILVRNPHLSWSAGYYEAHLTVEGVVDFYGDFRVGGPFGIVGGFNRHLGFATTNNGPDLEEVYALRADPDRPGHVLLDGGSVALSVDSVSAPVRLPDGSVDFRTRTFTSSPLGPVVAEKDGWVFAVKAARAGSPLLGVQFLRMMRARSLEEWKEAMRMQARVASNFTYADADGNIFYVWNAATPDLPHPPTGDTLATVVSRRADAWERLVPWDSLPQLLNPPGGYIHQENDPFHYTNLRAVFDPAAFPASFPEPELGLRSQHSLELIAGTDRLSLEEVVERKHSYRVLLADRVRRDLQESLDARPGDPGDATPGGEAGEVRASEGVQDAGERDPAAEEVERAAEQERAAELIRAWDGTAAPDSRGAVLFLEWWDLYRDGVDQAADSARDAGADVDPDADEPFAEPWSAERPTVTPRGLRRPDLAAPAFHAAMDSLVARWGAWDVAWGDVHRAQVGDLDLPVGGCHGAQGCFRVLWFEDMDDGRRRVRGGDGWVLAVEFGPVPRAFSVLAYGQSDDTNSPHCCDQLELFVEGRMKPVRFVREDVTAHALRRYRPGLPPGAPGH